MTKRTNLANLSALKQPATATESAQESQAAESGASAVKSSKAPARVGKAHVGGYFSSEVRSQLKVLAAEQDKTVQQLLGEGLNLMFSSYGKAEIAETVRG